MIKHNIVLHHTIQIWVSNRMCIKYDFTLYIFILFKTKITVNESLGPIKDRLFVSIKKLAFVILELLLRVPTMLWLRCL